MLSAVIVVVCLGRVTAADMTHSS